MTVRAFQEAAPLPVTARLGALLGAELIRVGATHLPDDLAVRRLLSTVRTFLLLGESVPLPGLGRLIPAGAAAQDPALGPEEGGGALGWARLAPDPDLHGQWPASALEPIDAFSRRWMSFVTPVAAGRDAPPLPAGVPVYAARTSARLPATVLVPTPDDPTDAFSLPWLNDVGARLSGAIGTLYVAGVHGAARTIYLGEFEQGRHVSLFSEEVQALFGELLPPEPHLPATPRSLWPLLAVASRELTTPTALAARLALGESGNRLDLDSIAGVVTAARPPDPCAPPPAAAPSGLAAALALAWDTDLPASTILTVLGRAFGRLSRELSSLPAAEACAELNPLGVLLRLDEPELRVTLPGGPGRAVLPARSRWVLAWRSS